MTPDSTQQKGNIRLLFLSIYYKFSPKYVALSFRVLLLSVALFSVTESALGQTTGDFRSNATSFNWSTAGSWQQYNGATWVTSLVYPGQLVTTTGNVTIQDGHTVTLDASPLGSIGSLTIGGGVSGSFVIGNNATARTISITNGITVGTGGSMTTGSTSFAHVLTIGGDLSNSGSINLHNATTSGANLNFNGNGQTISGTGTFTFYKIQMSTTSGGNVNVNSSIRINNNLTFTNAGILVVNSSSNITFGLTGATAATIAGAGATKYIQLDGTTSTTSSLIRTSDGTTASWQITYPIGTSAGGYTPMVFGTVGGTAPTSGATINVKALYNNSIQGQLRRVFRMTINGNAAATTFTGPQFNYNTGSDVSAGDAISNYNTIWYLSSSGGSWASVTGTNAGAGNFSITTPSHNLVTGTYYYTLGTSTAYPNTWYSYQTGVWSNWQNWTLDPSGTSLVNGLNLPPQPGDAIVILNGITITNDVSGQVVSSTTINGGATLDMVATAGNTLGTVTGTGLLRIKGINIPSGTYTSFVQATGGTFEYYDIGGTLSASQTTYNNLILSNTSSSITFTTYNASGTFVINGDLNIGTGAGTTTWQINTSSSTVLQTITVAGDVTVASGGKIIAGTGGAATNPSSLTLSGNFTNSGIVQFFDPTDATFSNANYTSGAVYVAATKGNTVNVTFTGANDAAITCNSQTDFYRLIVNKGTGQQATVTINSSAATNMRLFGPNNLASGTASNCSLSISNGTLQLIGTLTIPSLIENDLAQGIGADVFAIPQTGGLWLNSPNVNVFLTTNYLFTSTGNNKNDDQRLLVNGLFRVSNGSKFDAGYSRGIGSASGGSILIEGTNTQVNMWQYRPIATGTGIFSYTQSGGTVNVGTTGYNGTPVITGVEDALGSYTDQYARFSLAKTTSSFQMSGGVINIGSPTTPASGFGALAGGLDIQCAAGNYSVTGGTINMYIPQQTATASPTTGSHNFTVYSTAPLYNVNIYRTGTTGSFTAVLNSSITVLNNLTIVTGNTPTLNCSNNALTIGGNFNNQASTTFTPGSNVMTFNGSGPQTWTNSGTITSLNTVVLSKSSGTLTLAGSNLPSISTLTLTSGILADGGTTITVTSNITNNATHSGTGLMTLNGPTAIGGNNGIFGNLTISTNGSTTAAGTVTTSGNQTISGNLILNNLTNNGPNTILNIASNSLTVLGNISATGGFGANRCIQTSGVHNAGGLTRKGAAGDILFPVGTGGLYTPNYINVVASTYGTITMRAVNSEHPNVTTTNLSLLYYWRVTSSGYLGITNVTHKFYTFSTATKNGTLTSYRAARYDRTTNSWGTCNTIFDATSATAISPSNLNTGTGWTGVTGDKLDGEYTCGNIAAFGIVTTYYSKQSGNWNVNSTWSNVGVGGVAASTNPTNCTTCPVIIGDGASNNHIITTVAASSCGSITINSGSILDCSTFTGHNFGTGTGSVVSGIGTIRIGATGTGSALFPAGDFTNFLASGGGTVEWYGGTKTIPAIGPAPQNLALANYNYLVLNPTSGATITLPSSNLTIYSDVTEGVSTLGTYTGTVLTNGTSAMTINGNLNIAAGKFNFSNAASSATTMIVGGNTLVGSGASFGVVAGGTANVNTFSTPGSITNNGTISFNNTSVVNIIFNGSSDANFDGSGTIAASPLGTSLNLVTINKGTSQSAKVNFSVGGTVTAATSGWLTLINGTFDFQNTGPYTIVSTATTYSIPSTADLKISAGTVNILSNANNAADLLLAGTLEVSGGIANIAGGTSGNDIEYASAGTPTIIVSSGTLNVNGSIRRSTSTLSGALIYSQTGGNVTVGGYSSDNTRGVFEIDYNPGSSFTLTGSSTLTVQRQTGGSGYADVFIDPVSSNVSSTSTIAVGLTTATTQANLRVNIAPSIGNFTVLGPGASANPQTVNLFSNPMVLGGTLTIYTPSVLNTNSLDVSIAGNLTVTGTGSGTYNGGTNTTTFNGASSQSANLTASSSFTNMTINNSGVGAVTLSGTAPTLKNLNILDGILDVGSLALNINGDVVNNSSQIASTGGSITFTTTSTSAHTITSSNGSFTNLIVGGVGTTDVVTVNGNTVINGYLSFTNTANVTRTLFIGSSLLTFSSGTTVTGNLGTANGCSNFIKTNGVSSDLGVTKNWAVGGPSSFTYPLGTRTNYTPVSMTLTVTTAGSYTVVPVDDQHPTASATGDLILNYYWELKKDNSLVHSATGSLAFQVPYALVGGSTGTINGAYLDINAATLGWVAGGSLVIGNSTTPDILTFSSALATVMPGSNGEFDYSFGTTTSAPATKNTLPNPIASVYSRFADTGGITGVTNVGTTGGSWATATNWTSSSTGYGVGLSQLPIGHPVVILAGAQINLDLVGQRCFSTTISGLVVVTTAGHSLGAVSGTGTMRTTTNTFPAGDFTAFTSSSGGTIEYVAPMIMNSRNTYNNLSISSTTTGTVTMTNTDLIVNGNITIPANTTMDNTANNRNISIARNWANNGIFLAGTGTVTFNGIAAETITGATSFNNLTINNTGSGATVTGTGIVVNGTLTLTSGNLINSGTNPISLPLTTSTISGGSANSYIDGKVSKNTTAGSSITFPMGNANRYRPLIVGNTGLLDTWTVQYVGSNPTTGGYPRATFNAANLQEVSGYEYWLVGPSNTSNTADITLSYGPGSYDVPPSNIGTLSDLRIGHWDGTRWDLPGGGGTLTQAGSNTAGTLSITGVNSFSPFTIAAIVATAPLPVKLMSFDGERIASGVQLNWKTAQEINSDRFEIERSEDGVKFMKIGTQKAAGNSVTERNYQYLDKEVPSYVKYYYRLRQVDIDGGVEYSNVIMIQATGESLQRWSVSPNPLNASQSIKIDLLDQKIDFEETIGVIVSTVDGQQLFKGEGTLATMNASIINIFHTLSPGLYIVRILDKQVTENYKIVRD